MSGGQKQLLILASDFPPLAGTNTQRVQSFVRYLPQNGWDCTVATQAVADMPLIDSSELAAFPAGVSVVRVPNPDPFAWRRRRLGQYPADVAASEQTDGGGDTSELVAQMGRGSWLRSALSVPLHWVVRTAWGVPDALRPWAGAAAREGRRICRQQQVTAILSSSPSYSTQVAGLWLKRRTGLPWVVDYRDLWSGRPGRPVPAIPRRWREARLEHCVLAGADRIVVASPSWIDPLCQRYGEVLRRKMVWIPNGFDEAKMPEGWGPTKRSERLRVVYTGAMYASESPLPFLEALGRLKAECPQLVATVEIRLTGYADVEEQAAMTAVIARYELEETVHFLGTQSHSRCLAEQREADVLLLLSGDQHQGTIRGKSFEYLKEGKPILALVPEEGVQAELLRRSGLAWIVSHGNVAGIQSLLGRLLAEPGQLRSLQPNWGFIQQFSRRRLTADLAEVLEQASSPAFSPALDRNFL